MITTIFIIEALLKIIVYKIIFNGNDSYFRSYWNIIDFVIVIISVVSVSLPGIDLKVIKVLRMFRVLRSIKIISKNEGLRLSI